MIFDIAREPRREVYLGLLNAARRFGDSFTLVIPTGSYFTAEAMRILTRLEPMQLAKTQTHEWPGTTQYEGPPATLYRYRLDDRSLGALTASADGLYEWVQPDRPEDIAMLRFDGRAWLVVVAQHEDAYVDVDAVEREQLLTLVPGLAIASKPTHVED